MKSIDEAEAQARLDGTLEEGVLVISGHARASLLISTSN
jgi:hypothetical protein